MAKLLNQPNTFIEFYFYQEWKPRLNEEDAHPWFESMGSWLRHGCFPFGNDLFLSVSIDVHCFKRTPPNIVYHPLLNIHKDKIKKITQYNKFDTKVPIFAFHEDPHNADHITPHKPKKWEDIYDNK